MVSIMTLVVDIPGRTHVWPPTRALHRRKAEGIGPGPAGLCFGASLYRAGREAGRGILIHEHSETLTQTICFAMIAASQSIGTDRRHSPIRHAALDPNLHSVNEVLMLNACTPNPTN